VALAADYEAAESPNPVGVSLTVRGLVTNGTLATATTGAGADAVTFVQKGSGRIDVDAGAGNDTYNLHVGAGSLDGRVHIADTAGTDTLNVTATTDADEIWVSFTHESGVGTVTTAGDGSSADSLGNLTVGGSGTFTSSVEFLNVYGGDGEDLIHVQPSLAAGTEILIDGGAPSFGDPITTGDVLDFDPLGYRFLLTCGKIETNPGGTPAFGLVRYRDIESLPLGENSGNLGTTVRSLDFNPATGGVTQAGYNPVTPGMLYDGNNGNEYGWRTAVNGLDRGDTLTSEYEDLLRDGHWHSFARTFTAEVVNGWYLVSIKTGDKGFARDQLRVTNPDTGQVLVENASSPAGEIATHSFVMLVTDETLDLTFADMGGDPYWVVNGIEIRPGKILTFGTPAQPTKISDGISQTTFSGYLATPGKLVTVLAEIDTSGNGVPNGPVTITTADADPDLVGVQIRANDLSVDQPLYPGKPAGYFEYTLVHPSQPGTVYVKFDEASGDQKSCVAIKFQAPPAWQFDFNTPSSPTQMPEAVPDDPNGYIGVLPTDLTSPSVGYGWLTSPSSFDRGVQADTTYSDLLRDGAWGSGSRAFRVQLPVDTYEVTVTFGDPSSARDQMSVTLLQGSSSNLSPVTNVSTAAGQLVHRTFTATTNASGELVFQFSDGGGDPYWSVAGLEVRKKAAVVDVAAPADPSADGVSVLNYTVTNAAIGAVYTITATGGASIVTIDKDGEGGSAPVAIEDEDLRYAGVQIVPTDSTFTLGVQSPSSTGDVTVTLAEVSGATRGSVTQAYALPAARRFDFDGSGELTQTNPNFTSVRAATLYTAAAGYGWVTSPSEFQRDAVILEAWPKLYQDGHWGSAARTFQVQVDANQDYDVRVHTGDGSSARDQLQITVEGALAPVVVPATAANQFAKVKISGGKDMNGDGRLNITFADLGGDPFWTVNGLEVAKTGQLPDDLPPTSVISVGVDTLTADEGTPPEEGSIVTYTVSMTPPQTTYPVTVAYAISGTATPGVDFINAGGDYSALTGGTITFSPGQTSKTIKLQVVADSVVEPDETVIVTLSSPTGATIATGFGSSTHTILNDDFPPPPPTSWQFDFDAGIAATYDGYTSVGTSNVYNETLGYGWQSTASTLDRTTPNDLLRDGHWGTSNTFNVDVPNGTYVRQRDVWRRQFRAEQPGGQGRGTPGASVERHRDSRRPVCPQSVRSGGCGWPVESADLQRRRRSVLHDQRPGSAAGAERCWGRSTKPCH
jgi:hypothetical protein